MKITNLKCFGTILLVFSLVFFFIPKEGFAAMDISPPKVEDINLILPDKDVLEVGDTIIVRAEITDDVSGVSWANAYFDATYGSYTKSISISLHPIYGNEDLDNFYEGSYTLNTSDIRGNWQLNSIQVYDMSNNGGGLRISEIEKTNKVTNFNFGFKDIEPNKKYNTNVTPKFTGLATLNGISFKSGQSISNDGIYNLVISEPNGDITPVTFSIDKTVPIINGVTNNGIYNKDVSLSFNEGIGMLSIGNRYSSITEKQLNLALEGKYYFYVVDDAGNETNKISFLIDKTAPTIISSLSNSNPTNKDFYISITGKDTKEGYLVNSETSGS